MNNFYNSFIETAKHLAIERGLTWDLPCDDDGKVEKSYRWNLTALVGMVPPPTFWLGDLGVERPSLKALNNMRQNQGLPPRLSGKISKPWRDFVQAAIINELLVKRNKPAHAITNIGRAIRILATCAEANEPWDITADDVQLAYNVCLSIGESGKVASNFAMAIRIIIDGQHIADRCPLNRFCIPYPTDTAMAAQERVKRQHHKQNTSGRIDKIRKELHERKSAEKLPEGKAFWELVRIVFTEKPRTISDVIRFAQVRLGILTGFRIGENATIPLDWKRWREYVDDKGQPVGKKGGISQSLMIRHFAEKQAEDEGPDGIVLYETAQHVPQIFEDAILETLEPIATITRPMRERLRRQVETGRLFPEYEPNDIVDATESYVRVSGNLPVEEETDKISQELLQRYREDFDLVALEELRAHELTKSNTTFTSKTFIRKVGQYWSRYIKDGLIDVCWKRHSNHNIWEISHFRVGDVEDFVRQHLPTKQPDMSPFTLADGRKIYPHDLLFLMPVRALAENRNEGITDIGWYFSNGRVSPADLQLHLGAAKDNLFTRYGESDDDKKHSIDTHMLRHLLNTKLFRLGVADSIITKHFNRSSPAQSYVYDHRSLAEELDSVELPPTAETGLGPRAQEALKLIMARKVSGPVVEEFLRVQRELGDDVAFEYLDAEADGLHVTPYGFCFNSFTVDPCPKHLECYNGCRHLTRTDLPDEQRNLETLRDRLTAVIEKVKRQSSNSPGWKNQLEHAIKRLESVEAVLAAAPGSTPFFEGADLFQSIDVKLGSAIIDTSYCDCRHE